MDARVVGPGRNAKRTDAFRQVNQAREGAGVRGVAAELAARISEECFDFLENPVIRIAGEDIPISVSPLLETNSVPTPGLIVDAARMMLS